MKCILCGERKGKRFCPAKNTSICTQCCGEKRVVEIDCPSDCVYLSSGHTYQSIKKYSAQLQQEKDPLRRKKLYETGQHFGRLFGEIERAIIGYAADLRTLTDQHILQAVSLLKETYRTEQKGVIYEHSSANPLVQALVRDLRVSLEKIRTQPDRDFPIPKTADLLDCLEVVEQDIGYHLEGTSERGSYLGFIKKNHPDISSKAASKGSLIQP